MYLYRSTPFSLWVPKSTDKASSLSKTVDTVCGLQEADAMGDFPMQVPQSARPAEGLLPLLSAVPDSVSHTLAGLDSFWLRAAGAPDGVMASLLSTSQGRLVVSFPEDSPLVSVPQFVYGSWLSAEALPLTATALSQATCKRNL